MWLFLGLLLVLFCNLFGLHQSQAVFSAHLVYRQSISLDFSGISPSGFCVCFFSIRWIGDGGISSTKRILFLIIPKLILLTGVGVGGFGYYCKWLLVSAPDILVSNCPFSSFFSVFRPVSRQTDLQTDIPHQYLIKQWIYLLSLGACYT